MILDKILATKRAEVERLRERTTYRELERRISDSPACAGFRATLIDHPNRNMGLIAEVKKASPSKGVIRADFQPVELAWSYMAAAADCLSVLTDEQYFQGSNQFLEDIRQEVQIPILRKEFIVDELQILEARAIGADAILLIAAALSTQQMRNFHRLAVELGMDVLVEVHDREELERSLELDLHLLGINNRNLKTFVTDLGVTEQLMQFIPASIPVVSESGIASAQDVRYLQQLGVKALLIGETFMRQENIVEAVATLMEPVSR